MPKGYILEEHIEQTFSICIRSFKQYKVVMFKENFKAPCRAD